MSYSSSANTSEKPPVSRGAARRGDSSSTGGNIEIIGVPPRGVGVRPLVSSGATIDDAAVGIVAEARTSVASAVGAGIVDNTLGAAWRLGAACDAARDCATDEAGGADASPREGAA